MEILYDRLEAYLIFNNTIDENVLVLFELLYCPQALDYVHIGSVRQYSMKLIDELSLIF